MSAAKTPVMEQHAAAKRAYADAIVFFRLGDFYEMFGEDAVVAAKLLDLTLTSRNKGKPDEIPMAGVPHHAAHGYIARLLELGHKVAICEQMADPAKTRGIVPREVVRVITPGLVTERDCLDATTNNWLAALHLEASGVGIALLDLSTGELLAAKVADLAALLGELALRAPREVLVSESSGDHGGEAAAAAVRSALSRAAVRLDSPLDGQSPAELFGELAAEVESADPLVSRAVARALRFARACNPGTELPIRRIGRWDPAASLIIDASAASHLELVESPAGRSATLLSVIDATRTPPGARLLRRRLLAPLSDVAKIRRRQDLVELFVVHVRLREELRAALSEIGDLERLAVRASLGETTPRDLGALRDGLGAARRAAAVLEVVEDPALRETLGIGADPVDTVDELSAELARALTERPPAQAKDGAVFRSGYDPELDEHDALRKNGTERMVELEGRLREQTQVGTLKVRYTRVFGWYIEVSRTHASRVPSEWRRKQTVASGERFTTPELDDLADRILGAEERHRERELALLAQLVKRAAAVSDRVRALASRLSRWDVAAALADVAHRHDYARPTVDDSNLIEIRDGRHPVVERLAAAGRFVPNDVRLEIGNEQLWLITGPNMAGKSTLLRQVALTVILAQMGAFVPARWARIGIVDRVLSRVGASDNVARGESTFMVEMRETASILRHATRRSLVILDEIGRGTSTFDGLAIAWAVAEYLDEVIGCRALFATHYHELTRLAQSSRGVANHSVSARELKDDVVFLHRLIPGAASRSYGVAVAKLAGLPEPVLARARALLTMLESGAAPAASGASGTGAHAGHTEDQLDLFAPNARTQKTHDEVIETLRQVDVDRLTPLEALSLLARLRGKIAPS